MTGASAGPEWDADRFATLFSPATPRASPTLEEQQEALATIRPRLNHQKSVSLDSDFGSFVSVPAVDDPLGGGIGDESSSSAGGGTLIDFDSPAQAPSPNQHDVGDENYASLEFFDKFGREAKKSSEKSRHSVLDELLMHEDDPLYFLSETPPVQPSSSREPVTDNIDNANKAIEVPLNRDIPHISRRSREDAPKRPSISPTRSSTLILPVTPAPPVADRSNAAADASPKLDSSDTRSSTPRPPSSSSTPPTLSTPYSTLTSLSSRLMTSLLPSYTGNNDSINGTNNDKSIPGQKATITSSLEALFASDASSMAPPSTVGQQRRAHSTDPTEQQPRLQRNSSSSSSLMTAVSSTTTTTTSHPFFHLPFSQNIQQEVQITHGTPFGRSSKSSTITKAFGIGGAGGASPFGPHVYIPPSGAPGYRGEMYDWDKGYSEDLVRELGGVEGKSMNARDDMRRGRGREGGIDEEGTDLGTSAYGAGRRHKPGNGSANGNKVTVSDSDIGPGGGILGVAHLIEKKGGLLELAGRKASTTPVLEVGLADMIRTHLPALARLPKSWTLVYSLDQHGISLNTLYDRCEDVFVRSSSMPASAAVPVGAIVVFKDESGTVFGATLGREGVRRSRGRGYFGSGDSFLWKFVHGKQLKVFKWTGKNDYVALCEPDFISFGGGDGNYGLYLDDTLFEGSSAPCPTFDNEPLCVEEGTRDIIGGRQGKDGAAWVSKFECVGLEVWRIGP